MNTISQTNSDVNKKFTRKCPECNKLIFHTNKYERNFQEKSKRVCKSCSLKKLSIKYTGSGNPFYGKTHNPETMKRIQAERDISIWQTPEFKDKMSSITSGKNNGMYGRSVYSCWLVKYGKEVADKKQAECNLKKSINSSGKNNPMYGKPSPNGSGQGWKGYYKKHFFRSLRELSYMIYLEENNIPWITGETKKFSTEYTDYKGTPRTTRPDFFINNNELVEIKPLKLHTTTKILAKKEAMEKFCKLNNYKYTLIDFNIDAIKIKSELDNGNVEFIKNYKQKFLDYIKK